MGLPDKTINWRPSIIDATSDAPYVAIRSSFTVLHSPDQATLKIFADRRYVLWINGSYVQRGPMRFDPKQPSYDVCDVACLIKPGMNTIAVLLLRTGSNGQMMDHLPGLAVDIELQHGTDTSFIRSDESWKWSDQTGYGHPDIQWGMVCDHIDGRAGDAAFWRQGHDDQAWRACKSVPSTSWGSFTHRPIPQLLEARIQGTFVNAPNASEPGTYIEEFCDYDLGIMAHGYLRIDIEADGGSQVEVTFGARHVDGEVQNSYTHRYTCRSGRQIFSNVDTSGGRYIRIARKSGRLKVHKVEAVDCRYPFQDLGKFSCSDPFLTELWKRAIHTIRMCSTDAYLDCATRERAEWIGDAVVVEYPIVRLAFGGVRDSEYEAKSDPLLMESMIRRIAASQLEDGRLKAHHPSDRFDIHACIEDYSCLWIQAIRQVYEHTGNIELVRDMAPVMARLMDWFLARIGPNGLLQGREFVLFDNPLKYVECEGATLNAFFYRALLDAALLHDLVSATEVASTYRSVAVRLKEQYNKLLWNPMERTYNSGIKTGAVLEPTAHAALLALNRGIAEPCAIGEIRDWLFKHYDTPNGIWLPYTYFWLFEEWFRVNSPNSDLQAINAIRKGWAEMMERKDTGTLTEFLHDGGIEPCHCMGAVPAYFLSAFVLGVQMNFHENGSHIVISPHPGDLEHAAGTVVTELGLVDISWGREDDFLNIHFSVPFGATAIICQMGRERKFEAGKHFVRIRTQ